MRPLKPALLGIASFAVILCSWEVAVRFGWLNPFFTSQPTAIAAALAREARFVTATNRASGGLLIATGTLLALRGNR